MTKIELLTREAIVDISRQKSELETRSYLRAHFEDLSPIETRVLARPISPEKEDAIDRILSDLEAELQEVKASQLRRFVKRKFPSLEEEERNEFVLMFSRPIPPRRPPVKARLHIEQLVDRALELLTVDMEAIEARHVLRTEFPSLSSQDVSLLTQPAVRVRHEALEKVVRQLENEAKEKNVEELPALVKEKFPTLPSTTVGEFISDLARPIPPRRPKPRPKPRRKER